MQSTCRPTVYTEGLYTWPMHAHSEDDRRFNISKGAGMIASSSTFSPHPGMVIRDLFHQLHAIHHGTETLVSSNHPKEAAASPYLAIIFGRIASCIPWFLHSTAVFDIRSLTGDGWSYPSYCYSGDYPTRGQRSCAKCPRVQASNCTAKPESPAFWACLGVDPLDMPRTTYSGEQRKMLSTTHHALSPHPHIIICTSFISSIDYNVFIILQCHS